MESLEPSASSKSVPLIISVSFSVFCFLASFCMSLFVMDMAYGAWSRTRKCFKLRPYSTSLVKLERMLDQACEREEADICCLSNKRLSSYEFQEVILPFLTKEKSKTWRALYLDFNDFGDKGCDLLFETLMSEKCGCRLQSLSLRQCGITKIDEMMQVYLSSDKCTLLELNLAGNSLADDQIERLATILPYTALRQLDLSRNKLSIKSMSSLGHAVRHSRISNLKLRGNILRDEGIIEFSREALVRGSPLANLDISATSLADLGVTEFIPWAARSSLRELNIMENTLITDNGIREISNKLISLRVLNISKLVRLTDETCSALIASARHSNMRKLIRHQVTFSAVNEEQVSRIFNIVGTRLFEVVVILCAVLDLHKDDAKRNRCSFKLLPKEVLRTIVGYLDWR